MHITKSYKGLSATTKRQRALQDCRDYLGRDRYNNMMRLMSRTILQYHAETSPQDRKSCKILRQFVYSLDMLAGIQGYPATAMVVTAYNRRLQLTP